MLTFNGCLTFTGFGRGRGARVIGILRFLEFLKASEFPDELTLICHFILSGNFSCPEILKMLISFKKC